jgi:hypothetical protein
MDPRTRGTVLGGAVMVAGMALGAGGAPARGVLGLCVRIDRVSLETIGARGGTR